MEQGVYAEGDAPAQADMTTQQKFAMSAIVYWSAASHSLFASWLSSTCILQGWDFMACKLTSTDEIPTYEHCLEIAHQENECEQVHKFFAVNCASTRGRCRFQTVYFCPA